MKVAQSRDVMIVKECTQCHETKPLKDFIRRGSTYRSWCKVCKGKWNRQHYRSNKTYYAEKQKRHHQRMVKWAGDLKRGPCQDCGNEYPPVAMDWDHRPGEEKVGSISHLVKTGSKEAILAEIEKCDLVCAVCHRLRHAMRG